MIARILNDYGMILVLLALCVLFSLLTLKPQTPTGSAAARELAKTVIDEIPVDAAVIVTGAQRRDSADVAVRTHRALTEAGYENARLVVGAPRDLRLALDELVEAGHPPVAIAASGSVLTWRVLQRTVDGAGATAGPRLIQPTTHLWPDFLKQSNLLAIVDRIVVIAVIAIGMTMVIITAGIDLSVGSLIALSAVVSTLVMKRMGGLDASPAAVAVGFAAGIAVCTAAGALAGAVVARFGVAAFIVTLSVMMMARGLAFLITGGYSIYQVPAALPWLGQGRTLGVPNTVILLTVLYVAAHVFMAHTRLGRHIYAVGGNAETARLSGVRVPAVIVFVYAMSGLTAGLGGCIQASQLNTGTPNMGVMYELYVIAAVVLGGTSLAGGTGRVLGTLIGAFIISVIQNGMNLLGMESYTQQVVLGAVILAAVLLDKARVSGKFSALVRRK